MAITNTCKLLFFQRDFKTASFSLSLSALCPAKSDVCCFFSQYLLSAELIPFITPCKPPQGFQLAAVFSQWLRSGINSPELLQAWRNGTGTSTKTPLQKGDGARPKWNWAPANGEWNHLRCWVDMGCSCQHWVLKKDITGNNSATSKDCLCRSQVLFAGFWDRTWSTGCVCTKGEHSCCWVAVGCNCSLSQTLSSLGRAHPCW